MRKLFTIASLAALVLASCAKEEPKSEEKGEGRVSIACNVLTDVDVTRANVNCTTPAEADFSLAIDGKTSSFHKSYANIAEFNEDNYLYHGTYTATVTAGDINEEGYDKATFVGVKDFDVVARQETKVDITAKIANALVKVEVTDSFKTYFPGGYKLKLTTALGNEFDVTAQTDPLFIAPTSLTIGGTAIKQPNQSGENAKAITLPEYTNSSLAAQTYYTIKLDVENVGQATLTVTLNDTLVESVDIEQELNDNSENA